MNRINSATMQVSASFDSLMVINCRVKTNHCHLSKGTVVVKKV
jgi:hypothetical protein